MFDTAKFGALAAKLRKNADMTQSELADRLGLTRQAISRYECGDSFPDISVLSAMASIFGVSVETLISAGNPTEGEAEILSAVAAGREVKQANAADVANLAPWLRPSVLTKLSESMSKSGIDISALVELAEYMNETDTEKLMKAVDFDSIADMDPGLLSKLLPMLGPYVIDTFLQKILDGELDYHYLELLGDRVNYSLVEAAVVYGAMPVDALYILIRNNYNIMRWRKRGMVHIYTCPKCGASLAHFYPRVCKCGHMVSGDGNILHFAEETAALDIRQSKLAAALSSLTGDHLLILILGADIDMHALGEYYENAHEQCEMIIVDRDLARLEAIEPQLRAKSYIHIALVHDDPASPHLLDRTFDVIIDNTENKLADTEELRDKLKAGGCVIRSGETVYQR